MYHPTGEPRDRVGEGGRGGPRKPGLADGVNDGKSVNKRRNENLPNKAS